MNCVNCGRDANFHKVLVDLDTDSVVGGVCRSCEHELFQRSDGAGRGGPEECLRCGGPHRYAIPQLELLIESDGSAEIKDIEFDISRETIRLCQRHADEITTVLSGSPSQQTLHVPSKS